MSKKKKTMNSKLEKIENFERFTWVAKRGIAFKLFHTFVYKNFPRTLTGLRYEQLITRLHAL